MIDDSLEKRIVDVDVTIGLLEVELEEARRQRADLEKQLWDRERQEELAEMFGSD